MTRVVSSIAYQESEWTIAGQRFHYRWWAPVSAQGLLVITHGFGEHGGRYVPFAEALAQHGLWVAVPDLPGHGLSSGRRGNIPDIIQLIEQLEQLTAQVLFPKSQCRRYALFGHSFGGLLAIRWAMNRPEGLARLVVQSPLLEVAFPIPWWKTIAAAILSSLWPTASLAMNLDTAALSHDPTVVQAYRADPLVHNQMTARTYHNLLQVRDEVMARASTLRLPTRLLCGSADRIISVSTAERWFKQLSCEKSIKIFGDSYHELHHETVRDEILRLVCEWVAKSP